MKGNPPPIIVGRPRFAGVEVEPTETFPAILPENAKPNMRKLSQIKT